MKFYRTNLNGQNKATLENKKTPVRVLNGLLWSPSGLPVWKVFKNGDKTRIAVAPESGFESSYVFVTKQGLEGAKARAQAKANANANAKAKANAQPGMTPNQRRAQQVNRARQAAAARQQNAKARRERENMQKRANNFHGKLRNLGFKTNSIRNGLNKEHNEKVISALWQLRYAISKVQNAYTYEKNQKLKNLQTKALVNARRAVLNNNSTRNRQNLKNIFNSLNALANPWV